MWVIIGAVATLLVAALYWLFAGSSAKRHEEPDFAGGGAVTLSSSGSGGGEGESKGEEDDSSRPVITFFYGSQTGTAEGFAKTLANESRRAGFKPAVVDLEDFEADAFVESATAGAMVVFLMATYGEGEPTDNAAEFYEWLRDKQRELPEGALTGMKYTVFGLGNRQYEHFNKMGRVTRKRLGELGATEVFESGEGDDDGTLEEDFANWKEEMWGPMREAAGLAGDGGAGAGSAAGGLVPLDPLEWSVKFLPVPPSAEEVTAAHRAVLPSSVNLSSRYYFTSVPAKVVVNRELRQSGPGSTRHVEVDIKGTSLTYTAADNLGICAENDPVVVESIAQWMGYDLDAWFTLQRADNEAGRAAKPIFPTPCTVRQALARYCDFNGHIRKDFLSQLAHFATNDVQKAKLLHYCSKEGKAEFREWVVEPHRSMVEVFETFPSCRVPLERLIQMVPRLAPRLYTICSSNRVHANRIHAVVSVVQESKPGPGGRTFYGVCSNYMARTMPPATVEGRRTDGEESKTSGGARRGPWPTMLVHVRPSTFNLPEDASVPVIMVGPGTGIAPMRAFLQERRYQRQQGQEVGDTVLFFGCRRRDEDFIYRDELMEYCGDQTLTNMELAFSRETPGQKVYVQDKMKEHKDLIWRLVSEQGAHFYVCGGTHMGNDVQQVLEQIAEENLGSKQKGHEYVQKMHKDKRYVSELWS